MTELVSPYADAGAADIAFEWRLGPAYEVGDVFTSTARLVDLQTREVIVLDGVADVRDFPCRWYMPVMMHSQ